MEEYKQSLRDEYRDNDSITRAYQVRIMESTSGFSLEHANEVHFRYKTTRLFKGLRAVENHISIHGCISELSALFG
jgi:hypothetical protein